jgi:hypothetical protein
MKRQTILSVIALSALAISCSSTKYSDARAEETVNVDWGSTDLQTFSAHMVESLLESPQLNYLPGPGKRDDLRVIAFMGDVRNETSEHLNTRGLTDSIRTELLQSGKFRFVAGDFGQSEIGDQIRFQQGSGRVDAEMAKSFGKQLGADVAVYGALRSIVKKKGRSLGSGLTKTKDVYYQLVLNCVSLETGELIWSNEEELRKTARTALFGSD